MRNLSLQTGCTESPECGPLARGLYETLTRGNYNWPASIMLLTDFDGYFASHRTARRRCMRAKRLGYSSRMIDRSDHIDEIHAINTSAPERQGRPMSASYQQRPNFAPLPAYRCLRHAIRAYGTFSPDGRLVAYIVVYVCGAIALISQILGHADHLENDVMYLLAVDAFADTLARSGPVYCFYNRHDSGTEGLRFFKERLGFRPERVRWQP